MISPFFLESHRIPADFPRFPLFPTTSFEAAGKWNRKRERKILPSRPINRTEPRGKSIVSSKSSLLLHAPISPSLPVRYLEENKAKRWRRGRGGGRDRKGLVAKVTVPTDSSRKANSREASASRPASQRFLVCVAYVSAFLFHYVRAPSSPSSLSHPFPPPLLLSARTRTKKDADVWQGERVRARATR